MHLAILMTNTDESAFAERHPRDGEKFQSFLHRVRPNWTFEVFAVKDDVFPESLDGFDGVLITGSPTSVLDGSAWIERLLRMIRDMVQERVPLFGACFGHQAIALALGGAVGRNPEGWGFGLVQQEVVGRAPWMDNLGGDLALYAAHIEQVTNAPADAQVLTASAPCPVGGFAIGAHVFTTQFHPEMEPGFIAALTDELATELGEDVTRAAKASLAEQADTDAYAEAVARFFEQAVSAKSR